jgi:hypothetical protein
MSVHAWADNNRAILGVRFPFTYAHISVLSLSAALTYPLNISVDPTITIILRCSLGLVDPRILLVEVPTRISFSYNIMSSIVIVLFSLIMRTIFNLSIRRCGT